jgi:menaquinone-dependent protoporphyrinogen IX oxidase
VRCAGSAIKLSTYTAVILAASVQIGKYSPEMLRFVKDHLTELQGMPAPFYPCRSAGSAWNCRTELPSSMR